MKRLVALVVAAIAVTVTATPAHATIITYTNRASFDAAFPGAAVENWDGFASGTTIPNGSTVNGITYHSSNGNALVTNNFLPSTAPNTLGENVNGFFLGTDSMTFTFTKPLTAFGIDINTFATATGDYIATTNNGDVINSFFNPFPSFGTGEFIGFSSTTPFTSVTISSPTGIAYTLDTLRAQAVPEPATLAVFGTLALGAFGVRRRMKATA
jgi:PEP-CTERM motif